MEYTCTTAPVQSPEYLPSQQVRNGPHPLRRNALWLATAGLDTILDTTDHAGRPDPYGGTSGAEYKREGFVNLCQKLRTPLNAPGRPL